MMKSPIITTLKITNRNLRVMYTAGCLLCFPLIALAGGNAGTHAVGLWATLERRLDADSVKAGDALRAEVKRDWTAIDCTIPKGTMLKGQVVESVPRSVTSKITEVSVSFEAVCTEGKTVPLILIAVLRRDDKEETQMDAFAAMPTGIGPGASGRSISSRGDSTPSPNQRTGKRLNRR